MEEQDIIDNLQQTIEKNEERIDKLLGEIVIKDDYIDKLESIIRDAWRLIK